MQHLTNHAQGRSQGRCVPIQCIDYLLQHGIVEYDGNCRIFHLRDRRKWARFLRWAEAEGLRVSYTAPPYLVMAENGRIITTGWRDKKVMHNWRSKRGHKRAPMARRGGKRI